MVISVPTAALASAVADHPVAARQTFRLGNFRDDLKNMGHHCAVFGGHAIAVRNVRLGYHQHMGGGLWVDIPEGENGFVLVDLGGGDFPGDDFTKQTIRHISYLLIKAQIHERRSD